MSNNEGIYVLLRDGNYRPNIQEILAADDIAYRRIAYTPRSEDDRYLYVIDALDEKGNNVEVFENIYGTDASGDSHYSKVALNLFQLHPAMVITDFLDNAPFEIESGDRHHPFLVNSERDGKQYFPLDNLINLGKHDVIVVIVVEAQDIADAKSKIYDSANEVGKTLLNENFNFESNGRFGYWRPAASK